LYMKSIYSISCLLFVIIGFTKGTSHSTVSGKIYFSAKPFTSDNSGSKKSFSSNEFIYGRLELAGQTIKQAFKIRETSRALPYPFLVYDLSIWKNGEQLGSGSTNNCLLLSNEDANSSTLNFDVLPDPSKSKSIFSFLEDFSAGLGFVPFYQTVDQNHFPAAGNYKIRIKFFYRSVNAWGKEDDMEKWPVLEDEFDFVFKEDDIATLQKNKTAVTQAIRDNAFRYEKLPDVFSKPAKFTDPKATPDKLAAILKRDLPHRTILKWVVEQYSGPLWSVAKDEYNLPKYRYFNPHIYVAYKMDGKCHVGNVTLRENYEGGGNYGPLEVAYTSASEKQDRGIDCDKIK
jgi:hypothetical protein